MFPYVAAFLLAGVVIVLLYPLWRHSRLPLMKGDPGLRDEAPIARSLEKEDVVRILAQWELDQAQGKLTPEDYQRLKLTEERRLLTLLDSPEPSTTAISEPPSVKRSWGVILALGLWIVAGTMAVSSWVHQKIANDQITENNTATPPMGTPPVNPEEMVARLKARLEKNPDDLKGQMMLGRSYIVLERWKEAEAVWQKVLDREGQNPAAHAALGEILLRTHPPGDQPTAQAALAHFDKALIANPQDPSMLWARGVTLVALGRVAEADETWTTAYRSLTPGTPEASMVKDALETLRSGKLTAP